MALASIQTLSKVSWIGWVGLISLVASVLTVTIATGVQDRPAAAPQAPLPWDKDFQVVAHPTFQKAMSCVNQSEYAGVASDETRRSTITLSFLKAPSFKVNLPQSSLRTRPRPRTSTLCLRCPTPGRTAAPSTSR